MDSVAARFFGGGDQFGDVEVRFARGCGAEQDRRIGVADVGREAVRLGIHGNGRETFLVAGANHANRDFAAVRNQDALQRHPTSEPSANVSNALHNPPKLLAARR